MLKKLGSYLMAAAVVVAFILLLVGAFFLETYRWGSC